MNTKPYPHYFLADVPHELRRSVLDLCIHRQWSNALQLLCDNGFQGYDLGDLKSFYDWAPTVLEEPPNAHRSEDRDGSPGQPSDNGSPPAEQPCPDSLLNPESPGPLAHLADPEQAPETQPVPDPDSACELPADEELPAVNSGADHKRRGKVARLPKEIRHELNRMLDDGASYDQIIQWLAEKGHSGLNKVNLHNWRTGGYQDWVREQERLENQQIQREWLADTIRENKPEELNQFILQLFTSQLMDTLFGMDTEKLKASLPRNPRCYVALLNSFCRMNKQAFESEQFRNFLAQQRENANSNGRLSDKARRAILQELRFPFPAETRFSTPACPGSTATDQSIQKDDLPESVPTDMPHGSVKVS